MFPILVTVQNETQLAAVKAALSGAAPATPAKPALPPKSAPAAKTSAPAAVAAKAAAAAEKPLPTVDMKALGTVVTHVADDYIVGEENIGRPRIVALLEEFGAKKLNQVPSARLNEFATKVKALDAELAQATAGSQEAATEESLV